MVEPIVLIHIGDIHLRDADNPILKRVPEVIEAIRAQRLTAAGCFLVVQGDIAFSGTTAEYSLAQGFFTDLLSGLAQEFPGVVPQIIFVPGNHDCDLTAQSDIRKAGLTALQIADLDVMGGFAREFLAVQENYFEFVARFNQAHKTQRDRLHLRRLFSVPPNRTVGFSCVNTAWMSTNPEIYGRLLYPNHLHPSTKDLTADVEIVVAHHPPHWLEPENGRAFRDHIEKKADIVLTGHEHRHEIITKVGASFNVEYLAGKAMFDAGAADNGFNVITIDADNHQWTVTAMLWSGSRYEDSRGSETKRFLRNKALADQGFENNSKFVDELTDVGTGFTHAKKHLRLGDIFVYPNLFHRRYQRNLDGKHVSPTRVKGADVVDFLARERRLFILGANRSGKSAFARTLYRLLQTDMHLVPVLLNGANLKHGATPAQLVDDAYRLQYSPTSLPLFKRLAANRTCLIIDDLDKATLSRKAHAALIGELEKIFGKIIRLSHDLFDLDQVLEGKFRPLYYDYRQYVIEEFNRVQRGALIEKWVTLGRPDWEQEDQLHREVLVKEKVINALLGRQLVPAYPIVVMAMLQTMESMRTPNTVSGSYGELYEALITDRLARVSRKATDLGISYALISRIAFQMYERESGTVTEEEVELICDEYFAEYQIRRSARSLVADLVEAGIFRQADGNLHFLAAIRKV